MNEPTEDQIKAVSTAPRVTPADIEANIVSEHYFTAAEGTLGATIVAAGSYEPTIEQGAFDAPKRVTDLLTFCVLVLRNGFTVTGESACASPENFDAEIGRKIARANAVAKCWPLLGFALKEKLFQASLLQSAVVPEHWNADGSPRPGNPLLG